MELYKIKKYLWSGLGVAGVVFFWAGVWDGLGNLWLLTNPLVSLAVGLLIFLVSAVAFGKLDLKSSDRSNLSLLYKVKNHPKKHHFHIHYKDHNKKSKVKISAKYLVGIEKTFLILREKGHELFIPIYRVEEILHKDKPWSGKK